MQNPLRLVVLQAVIAAGSVTEAARNLSYAPATISQHLAALARETGLTLFERAGRGIVPTEVARHLAEAAAPILRDLDRLERTIADLRTSPATRLAIACFASVAAAWLPDAVRAIRSRHPSVTIEVSLNESSGGHGRRAADLDIQAETGDDPETRLPGYQRHELLTEDFLVALPADHRLAGASAVAMAELGDEPWVDYDIYDSPTGQMVTRACGAAGFVPRYVARLDDHRSALGLVAAGIGVSVLPALALRELPTGAVVRPLTNPTPQRRIVAHVRRDRRSAALTAETLELLHERARADAGAAE